MNSLVTTSAAPCLRISTSSTPLIGSLCLHAWFVSAAALAKYGKGQSTDDLGMAVEMFLERNLVPRLPPQAQLVCNDFRTERLYTEEVGWDASDLCAAALIAKHWTAAGCVGHHDTPPLSKRC